LPSSTKLPTSHTAAAFLTALIDAVPYQIHTVLTDNGVQFGDMPSRRSGRPRQQLEAMHAKAGCALMMTMVTVPAAKMMASAGSVSASDSRRRRPSSPLLCQGVRPATGLPNNRTPRPPAGIFAVGHGTKSLRDSPLRGSLLQAQ
jgi:hypothetical protein